MTSLVLRQQWGTLPILTDHLSAFEGTSTGGDGSRRDEENSHDDEGKDPLEGNDLGEELRDADGCDGVSNYNVNRY